MAIALTSDPIVTAVDVEAVLITGATDDQLNAAINSVSERFKKYTNRVQINSAEVTEYQRSLGLGASWLHAAPVDTSSIAITIYQDGEESETRDETDVTAYASGRLYWNSNPPPTSPHEENVKIVYTGGWDTVPGDVQQTAMELVRLDLARLSGQIGAKSVSFEGSSTSYETTDLPQAVREVWDRYRFHQ